MGFTPSAISDIGVKTPKMGMNKQKFSNRTRDFNQYEGNVYLYGDHPIEEPTVVLKTANFDELPTWKYSH
jgi:hypothetical protein